MTDGQREKLRLIRQAGKFTRKDGLPRFVALVTTKVGPFNIRNYRLVDEAGLKLLPDGSEVVYATQKPTQP